MEQQDAIKILEQEKREKRREFVQGMRSVHKVLGASIARMGRQLEANNIDGLKLELQQFNGDLLFVRAANKSMNMLEEIEKIFDAIKTEA